MLLRRLADALIIFHKGGAEYFDGSYDEFLEKIGWEEEEGMVKKKVKSDKPKMHKKEYKKLQRELTQARSKESTLFKKELELCEKKIMELEVELKIENEKLVKASNTGDNSSMIEASKNVGKVQKEVDDFLNVLKWLLKLWMRLKKNTN
jgi:ATP-binding cassette subfamily F protein 3